MYNKFLWITAFIKLEVFNYSLNGFIAPSLKEVRDPNEGYLGSLMQDMMISKRPESWNISSQSSSLIFNYFKYNTE
jgi:hypothetical protein